MKEETGEPAEIYLPLMGNHYLVTHLLEELSLGSAAVTKKRALSLHYPGATSYSYIY